MEDNNAEPTRDAPCFRLYVVDQDDPEQSHVADIVRNVCVNVFGELGDFEVVSVAERPELSSAHAVYATPLLERVRPTPVERYFGNLADSERLFELLSARAHEIMGSSPEAGEK